MDPSGDMHSDRKPSGCTPDDQTASSDLVADDLQLAPNQAAPVAREDSDPSLSSEDGGIEHNEDLT